MNNNQYEAFDRAAEEIAINHGVPTPDEFDDALIELHATKEDPDDPIELMYRAPDNWFLFARGIRKLGDAPEPWAYMRKEHGLSVEPVNPYRAADFNGEVSPHRALTLKAAFERLSAHLSTEVTIENITTEPNEPEAR
jgi:hypothetical protein